MYCTSSELDVIGLDSRYQKAAVPWGAVGAQREAFIEDQYLPFGFQLQKDPSKMNKHDVTTLLEYWYKRQINDRVPIAFRFKSYRDKSTGDIIKCSMQTTGTNKSSNPRAKRTMEKNKAQAVQPTEPDENPDTVPQPDSDDTQVIQQRDREDALLQPRSKAPIKASESNKQPATKLNRLDSVPVTAGPAETGDTVVGRRRLRMAAAREAAKLKVAKLKLAAREAAKHKGAELKVALPSVDAIDPQKTGLANQKQLKGKRKAAKEDQEQEDSPPKRMRTRSDMTKMQPSATRSAGRERVAKQ
jgi:hypothetical protein